MTKAQMASELASQTGLTKAQVASVMEAMGKTIHSELKAGRPCTINGLMKIVVVRKAATGERQGKNPRTGEMITIKAKPARKMVRVRALKALKDMV